MARPDMKKPIIEWLKKVNKDESIFTRRFFDITSFYQLYIATSDKDCTKVTLSSFKKLVDSICSKCIYKNLKRKVHKCCNNKRFNEYIIVSDKEAEKDLTDINVYFTRKRKTDAEKDSLLPPQLSIQVRDLQTSTKKTKTASASSYVDHRAGSIDDVNKSTKTVAPTIKPTYIPYPVPVPVPIPITLPSHAPVVAQLPPDQQSLQSPPPVVSVLPSISSNPKVSKYVHQSQFLDFSTTPRKNIFSPWLDDIPIKAQTKIADDNFRYYLLQIASELNFGDYTCKEQLELAEAIIKKECFIAGYKKPVFSA